MIKTTTFTNTTERKIFVILFSSIIFSLFLYVFFIGVMSVSAAQMGGLEKEIRTAGSNISELEEEYVALTSDVTLSYAYSLGFKEPQKVAFATRKTFAINFGNEK
jgi:hypothetical protein